MEELEKYSELKSKLSRAAAATAKAEGGLDQLRKNMKTKFDCTSLKSAKAKLKKLQAEEEEAKSDYETKVKLFEETWKLSGGSTVNKFVSKPSKSANILKGSAVPGAPLWMFRLVISSL